MDIDIAGPIIDAIVKKQSVILKLDEQILENTSDEDIEVEITDADEYNLDLETNLRRYKKLAQTVTRTCTELSHESIPNTRPVMNMHDVNSETRPNQRISYTSKEDNRWKRNVSLCHSKFELANELAHNSINIKTESETQEDKENGPHKTSAGGEEDKVMTPPPTTSAGEGRGQSMGLRKTGSGGADWRERLLWKTRQKHHNEQRNNRNKENQLDVRADRPKETEAHHNTLEINM
ncbi:unnamed protein product [Mytilus edulis]|uniref:Uncharacterized protein n=1 Tax=Mytilus edulis TaxID=6550 RepID=A0A8S3S7L0_MYTED|nr:unnamed protein product [Mytilus edulis]